jgi:hypothetical protein
VTIGELDAKDTVAQPKNFRPGFIVTSITDEIRKEARSPGNMRGVVVASITGENLRRRRGVGAGETSSRR